MKNELCLLYQVEYVKPTNAYHPPHMVMFIPTPRIRWYRSGMSAQQRIDLRFETNNEFLMAEFLYITSTILSDLLWSPEGHYVTSFYSTYTLKNNMRYL